MFLTVRKSHQFLYLPPATGPLVPHQFKQAHNRSNVPGCSDLQAHSQHNLHPMKLAKLFPPCCSRPPKRQPGSFQVPSKPSSHPGCGLVQWLCRAFTNNDKVNVRIQYLEIILMPHSVHSSKVFLSIDRNNLQRNDLLRRARALFYSLTKRNTLNP